MGLPGPRPSLHPLYPGIIPENPAEGERDVPEEHPSPANPFDQPRGRTAPLRERLQNSWAETFYREFFCRLDEQPFAVLYADEPSRSNVPVNVLVGLEFLKAANGWTDEEMYNEFCYNVQVRYALGYRHLGEGYFDLRTLYYFRERLAHHMQETGENLLEQAFEQVTDEQLEAFSFKTGKQRMDSTFIG